MINRQRASVAVIGGGPAGLMAAETAAAAGAQVDLYDAMASVGRKFLLAGKGGLNLTYAEPAEAFLSRYGTSTSALRPILREFDADALRAWAAGLGINTFVGSSQRVFPDNKKAAPLLRAWVRRLRESGVQFHTRHRWLGWDTNQRLQFHTPQQEHYTIPPPDATVLALGGGSWPRLGSDGTWQSLLTERGVAVRALRPSNCGFDTAWSAPFAERFAGQPVKNITARQHDGAPRRGELMITSGGVEGSLIYALSGPLRDQIDANGSTVLTLDLVPDRDAKRLADALNSGRRNRSLSERLRRGAGINPVKVGLLRELAPAELRESQRLVTALKNLPLRLTAARPLAEAISSAGGVCFDALDERLMCRQLPGVFYAGEMLDWEAPTGGYLLTACFASGHAAAQAALDWLQETSDR